MAENTPKMGEVMTDADFEKALDALREEDPSGEVSELLKMMSENRMISWEEAEQLLGGTSYSSPIKSSLPTQTRPSEPDNDTDVDRSIQQLQQNDPKLKQINLNNMKRTPIPQMKRLIAAIRDNTSLEKLAFANMGLYDNDVEPIFDVIENNTTLKALNFETNYLSGDFFARLFKAALVNQTLEEVKAVNQGVTFATTSEKEIIDAVYANRGLIKVSINLRLPEGRHKIENTMLRNGEIRRILKRQAAAAAAAAAAASTAAPPSEDLSKPKEKKGWTPKNAKVVPQPPTRPNTLSNATSQSTKPGILSAVATNVPAPKNAPPNTTDSLKPTTPQKVAPKSVKLSEAKSAVANRVPKTTPSANNSSPNNGNIKPIVPKVATRKPIEPTTPETLRSTLRSTKPGFLNKSAASNDVPTSTPSSDVTMLPSDSTAPSPIKKVGKKTSGATKASAENGDDKPPKKKIVKKKVSKVADQNSTPDSSTNGGDQAQKADDNKAKNDTTVSNELASKKVAPKVPPKKTSIDPSIMQVYPLRRHKPN